MPAGVLRESPLIIWCESNELSKKKLIRFGFPRLLAFFFLFPLGAWCDLTSKRYSPIQK